MVDVLEVVPYLCLDIFRRNNTTRIQRSAQGASQSFGGGGDRAIQRRRMLLVGRVSPVFVLAELHDFTLDAEIERLIEALHAGGEMSSLVFADLDTASV